eukprot:265832_1
MTDDFIDLSIFHKDGNECVPSDYTKCDAMARLIGSSQYNTMLKMNKNADSDEILRRFMNDVYNGKGKGLIDDYIHFKDTHEHELVRITRDLMESKTVSDCSIRDCVFTRRHMNEPSACTGDTNLSFYEDTFDALHFHLFHCFEAGLRVRKRDDNDEMEEDEKATNDEYFDPQFARLNGRILD